MRLFMVVVMLLFLGTFFIVSNENLRLSDEKDFGEFSGYFYSWLDGLYYNVRSITAHAVKLDWMPSSGSDS